MTTPLTGYVKNAAPSLRWIEIKNNYPNLSHARARRISLAFSATLRSALSRSHILLVSSSALSQRGPISFTNSFSVKRTPLNVRWTAGERGSSFESALRLKIRLMSFWTTSLGQPKIEAARKRYPKTPPMTWISSTVRNDLMYFV